MYIDICVILGYTLHHGINTFVRKELKWKEFLKKSNYSQKAVYLHI